MLKIPKSIFRLLLNLFLLSILFVGYPRQFQNVSELYLSRLKLVHSLRWQVTARQEGCVCSHSKHTLLIFLTTLLKRLFPRLSGVCTLLPPLTSLLIAAPKNGWCCDSEHLAFTTILWFGHLLCMVCICLHGATDSDYCTTFCRHNSKTSKCGVKPL